MLIPILIGLALGAGYFLVLSRFTAMVTGGAFSMRVALFGFAQFLIPLAILLVCAFVWKSALLGVGIGMASAIMCLSVIKLFVARRRSKGRGNKDA